MADVVRDIPIDAIDDPEIAMRTSMLDEDFEVLKRDMAKMGLIQPITVRPKDGRYEIIAGHRRTTAARALGWASISAKIVEADDDQAFAMRTMENLSRADVNPVDEACYIGEMITKYGKTEQEVAEISNRGLEWVRQRLEVFEMPEYLQNYLRGKQISLGAALILNKIPKEESKRYLVNYAAQNGVTIAQAKRWLITEEANAQNPEFDVRQVATMPDEPQQSVTLVKCARCGQLGPLPDMDTPFVHRGVCPEDGEEEAELHHHHSFNQEGVGLG